MYPTTTRSVACRRWHCQGYKCMSVTEDGCRLTASSASTQQDHRSSTHCLELSLTVRNLFCMVRPPTITFTANSPLLPQITVTVDVGKWLRVFGRMHGFQYTMGSFAPEGARTAAFCGAERFPHRWSDPQLPIAAVQLRPLSDVRIDSYTPPTRVFSRSMAVPTLLGGHHPSPQLWMMSSTALVMA